MPTSNDWLRQIHDLLKGGSTPGGGGGGGLSEAQTTAAVKAAIETATNLTNGTLTSSEATAATKAAIETASNLDEVESRLQGVLTLLNSTSSHAPFVTSAVKEAIETATNLDQVEAKLDALLAAQTGATSQSFDAATIRYLTSSSPEYNNEAGSRKSLVVPAGKVWLLRSASFRYVSSATVATRKPAVLVSPGGSFTNGGWVYLGFAPVTQPATTVYHYNFGSYTTSTALIDLPQPSFNATHLLNVEMAALPIPEGFSVILLDTQLADPTGDNLANVALLVQERNV